MTKSLAAFIRASARLINAVALVVEAIASRIAPAPRALPAPRVLPAPRAEREEVKLHVVPAPANPTVVAALRQLGFKDAEIRPVLGQVNASAPVETQVKEALRLLGRAA